MLLQPMSSLTMVQSATLLLALQITQRPVSAQHAHWGTGRLLWWLSLFDSDTVQLVLGMLANDAGEL